MNTKISHIFFSLFLIIVFVGIISDSFRSGMRRLSSSFSGGITSIPSSISEQYSETKNNFTDSKILRKEVKRLKVELQTQKLKYFDSEVLRRENAQLKRALKLKDKSGMTVLAARIIVREPLSWFRSFTINRGRKDGVLESQPVLYDGYLIGQIKKVYEDRSLVITIADKDCWVSCQIKDTVLHGVLKGKGGGSLFRPPECELEYIFRDADLKSGMIIETSGFGENIPAGIPVGSLIGESDQDVIGEVVNNVFKKARVYPYADFKDPTFVTVITNK